jgi:hypothetical protein
VNRRPAISRRKSSGSLSDNLLELWAAAKTVKEPSGPPRPAGSTARCQGSQPLCLELDGPFSKNRNSIAAHCLGSA